MNILLLVVLYKTELDCSDSLRSLAEQSCTDGLHVFVWDNSPEKASTSKRVWLSDQFKYVYYHHDRRNTSLSDLYNCVIKRCLSDSSEKYKYLMLLDQDSILESAFLLKMGMAAARYPEVKLLLPVVRASGQIVSPGHLYYFKGSFWKRPSLGLIKSRFTTAINSGMMISADYLVNEFAGYPSEIPFYGTDNWLCQAVAQRYRWMYVVDTTIKHDLAQFREETNDVKLWRHRQNVRATRFLNRRGFIRRSLCFLYTTTSCIRGAIKYHDWRFLH